MFDECQVVKPSPKFFARRPGKVGPDRKQFLQRLPGLLAHAKLPVSLRNHGVGIEVSRLVELERGTQGAAVIAPAIRVVEVDKSVPARMTGIELHGGFHDRGAAFPVTGIGDEISEERRNGSIHAVQFDRSLRCGTKSGNILLEKQGGSEGVMGEVVRGRRLHGAPRGRKRTPQRVGLWVQSVRMLFPVQVRQHGPGIAVIGRNADGPFQDPSHARMFFRRDAFHVAKRAQHRFVRTQLFIGLCAERLAHAAGQNAVHVRNRRDDPRNQIVLQLKDRLGTKGAFEVFSPEMSAAGRIDELNREPQLGPGLPKAAFHHVARAQFLAGGSHVKRLLRVARSRAARDHPEIREARQASHDFLGQPLCQGCELGVGAAVLERQHGDPEALVGARLSGVCA